jgi:hypothetical protein
MSSSRFYISRIALSGPGIEDAEVLFEKGLNIISGPSDTGKTFILQCIDFMLGSQSLTYDYPEAEPYDTVIMDLTLKDDEVLTFRRALKGGAFSLFKDGQKIKNLSPKHNAENEDNLSNLLLKYLNLSGKKVVKSKKTAKTRTVSYRDLAHLTIISEEDIIKSNSPVLSDNPINKTVEQSIFDLLTSGEDDSSVESIDDPKISKSKTEAKIELLKEMLNKKQHRLSNLDIKISKDKISEKVIALSSIYDGIKAQIDKTEGAVSEIENSRQETWEQLNNIESRKSVLSGLEERFQLLRKQYDSDLMRLEAISESGFMLGELTEERCPICGALPEHHEDSHSDHYDDPQAVSVACSIEATRIRSLIADLEKTNQDLRIEANELDQTTKTLKENRNDLDDKLKAHYKPRMNDLVEQIRKNEKERDSLILATEMISQIEEISKEIEYYSNLKPENPRKEITNEKKTLKTMSLCNKIEEILEAWQFPDYGRVTFNQKTFDIDIGGRTRESHGKGVRAISHSAFTLGLLANSSEKNLPHPGVVVLDSPLVVYREPDKGEDGDIFDVKDSLLIDTASRFKDEQVIILENEKISDELERKINGNVIRFTGNKYDRSGFLKRIEKTTEQ